MTAPARNPERGRRTLTAERLDDGLVVLSFYVAEHRQNVITEAVIRDLADALDGLDAGPEPRGVVLLSARSGSFFAGADINRLNAVKELPPEEIERLCATGRGLFSRLSERPWPTVAVIDGVCLGGGLEMALACDLRIATSEPHTVIGLPEVKLGLLPGWGGTVRLSRLIGPGPAVEFAASGEPIDAAAALRVGLVDACVKSAQAFESARRLVEHERKHGDYLARRQRMAGPCRLAPEEKSFLEATSAAVILGRTGGHYPAPPTILATILAGSEVDAEEAGRIEGRAFAALARSSIAAQLVRVFRIGERNRHDAGIDAPGGDAPAMERPAVVGAGIMGAGIAASHLRAGFNATLVDVQPEALARSVTGILDEAAWDRTVKRTDPARALALAGNLRTATQLSALAGSDIVIESVVERTDVKRQVLTEIEQMVDPATVIATNTSTNPITKLATALSDPSRFCGLHFFNPVRRMTLVEVVRGPATSDRTIAIAVAHAKRLGKCPIVVHDSPGFLVNRLLMPYLHESVEMLREGGEAKRIDRVARAFGMPMGPLELYDMIGLDTAFYAGLVLNDAYGDRIEASPVIPALVRSGRLGCKSGGGFYIYSDGASASKSKANSGRPRIVRPDEGVADLVAPYALPSRPVTDAVIADRLLLPMVLEATRVLDEGIVRDGRDIDLAVIHALGFPAFRGGVLAWADSLGAAEICRRLEPLADLGVRMHPTPRLIEMARTGGRFTTED
jgi:3-hydroxyacyl-CoA dehydrogenase/enoyl-CoA hydratase/3-hydroxybutyryl-CoA epimerase/3-hydroxyacyl-CoA dehydrogenase/enoyl-CoA hydratase/3-hydroxybutyryl-CoA epimerase/enoyl-CoA isomerase